MFRGLWQLLPLGLLVSGVAAAQDEFERPPIEYSAQSASNPVSKLQDKLNSGGASLAYDEQFGYLPALLTALEIDDASQMLVFSKTSMQRQFISPRTPRAIYFNDDVYVGYCHAGDVLEISVADPKLGTAFYTLKQKPTEKPALVRQTESCLQCHGGSQTDNIPGHLVRSLFVDAGGQPIFSEGSFRVDHTTPFENRWGGWYVTGTHGKQSHLGNLISSKGNITRPVQNEAGQNVKELDDRFDVKKYLTPHSDIVALLVLEHQTLVHNLITKANFTTRQALHYEAEFNRALGEPASNRLDSTTSRIRSAGDDLIEGLLLVDEAPLTSPVNGTSKFAEKFAALGPRDKQGRSLRDFDLEKRLFKYPCSYLIYSPAFDELPMEMKVYVARRFYNILKGVDRDEKFAHLSPDDRRAILEIIEETKPELFQGLK